MEIKIYAEKSNGDLVPVELSDEGFEIAGWLRLSVDGEEIGDIHVDDLMPAIISFDAKASRAKEKETPPSEA